MFQQIYNAIIVVFLLSLLRCSAESGVEVSTTKYTYSSLVTTTITDSEYVTHVSVSSDKANSSSSVAYYTLNNKTYTVTGSEAITLTNCPCTLTSYSVVTETYVESSYASNYWITVNQSSATNSTSSGSPLTGTFIQSTATSSSPASRLNAELPYFFSSQIAAKAFMTLIFVTIIYIAI